MAERTEKPTAKRLKEARDRGQIARSRDLSMAVASLSATAALTAYGGFAMHRLAVATSQGLNRISRAPLPSLDGGELEKLVLQGGALVALIVGPVAAIAGLSGVAAAVAQGGFTFSLTPLHVNWGRLSPMNGLAKFKPTRAGLDTLKTIAVAIALGVVGWKVGREVFGDLSALPWETSVTAADYVWRHTRTLLWRTGFVVLAVGAADYGLQFWRTRTALKMTRQEIKEEARATDGSPEVKARVRRVRRDLVKQRMLTATKRATVVITNPTHVAVALEYRKEKAAAPVVVAKGRELMAARIREIARTNGVPIIENPPLARALYQGTEVGDMIPAALFGAVAEVLAYLIRIKQLIR